MQRIHTLLAAALVFALAPAALADEPSLDEQLGLVDPVPTEQADEQSDAEPKPLLTEKEFVEQPEIRDQFAQAVIEMEQAADRLGNLKDPGVETQRIQEDVIRKLDVLLSEMNKQCKSCQKPGQSQKQDTGTQQSQSKQGQPGQPQQPGGTQAAQQAGARGSVQQGELNEPLKEQLTEWGDLPPRLRDQITQGLDDNFSQLYRDLTERFYRRLAEQVNE